MRSADYWRGFLDAIHQIGYWAPEVVPEKVAMIQQRLAEAERRELAEATAMDVPEMMRAEVEPCR